MPIRSRKREINNRQFLPNEHRQRLPFGVHEQQITAGKNILDRIPTAKRNFERLMAQNGELATLILSKVHRKYYETQHHRAKPEDTALRDRLHRQAAQDVTRLVGRGFVVNRVLKEMNIGEVRPEFVDAMLKRKMVLRVPEAKNIYKKLAELERLDRHRAKETRSRLSSQLTAPLSRAEGIQGMTHYKRALGYIERQIEFAKNNH